MRQHEWLHPTLQPCPGSTKRKFPSVPDLRLIRSVARCSNSGCTWSAASSFVTTSSDLGVSVKLPSPSSPDTPAMAMVVPVSSFDTAARRTVCVLRRCCDAGLALLAELVPRPEGSGATIDDPVDAPQPMALEMDAPTREAAERIFHSSEAPEPPAQE